MSRSHGRVSTYRDGCRCDPCREAKRDAQRSVRFKRNPYRPGMTRLRLWDTYAACKGQPSVWWFPERGMPVRDVYAKARAICKDCPCRLACLEEAMEQELAGYRCGMFGGLSPDQRDNLGKLRRAAKRVNA